MRTLGILADVLSMAGAVIMIAALVPVQKLIAELPHSSRARRQWQFLSALIAFVVTGYVAYAVGNWKDPAGWTDLLVPLVFVLAASTILVITTMSHQTAHDVRRLAVLEQENITDPMMGIYNRRYMDGRLRQEILRARRHNLPLSVLLIDADHFKKVNDTWGHHVGDLCLAALGDLVVRAVRVPDAVVRYGGEEILVIAPDTPLESAGQLGERLRQAVESAALVPAGERTNGQAVRLTCSVGVAALGPEPEDMVALLDDADQALYRAKHGGRNRVELHRANRTPG